MVALGQITLRACLLHLTRRYRARFCGYSASLIVESLYRGEQIRNPIARFTTYFSRVTTISFRKWRFSTYMQRNSRFQRTMFAGLVFSLLLTLAGSVHAQEKSLYERVGGYNALAAVVDDFVGRLVADKQFEKFFVGHSTDSKKRIRQHILDQFCAATGGPCVYTGRDMKMSHSGLGITNADWDAAAKHLTASLDKFKVPEKEKGEILAFVTTLKNDIVEK